MLSEMNWEAFQSIWCSKVNVFKHLMVVGVRENEAFNSLHELRLIVLEEPSDASATSRVGNNRERRGWALSLIHEILPDILAVFVLIATVRNWLFWDWIVSNVCVEDNDRLTHCLSIFDVGKLAAHVETCVDTLGSSPSSSNWWVSTFDKHKAATWIFIEVWANEDVTFGSIRLAIITNPYFLHSILSFHSLLNVPHSQITNLFKRLLSHSPDRLSIKSYKTTAILIDDTKASLGKFVLIINSSNDLMELWEKLITGSSLWLDTAGSILTTSSGSSSCCILSHGKFSTGGGRGHCGLPPSCRIVRFSPILCCSHYY